jgi:quercetin dioxygenase-like cupin family protein
MKIFRSESAPIAVADARTFAGAARTQRLAVSDDDVPVHVYRVEFEPGGRTNWHTHSGPQWLLIVEGRVRVQTWGEAPQDVSAGDAVVIPPGEKHWHGSVPGRRGVHLAVNVRAETTWLEAVSDAEYGASE